MKRTLTLAVVIALFCSMAVSCNKEVPLTAAELLSLGEKFLLELDYEQAVVQFLNVIEIEPKNPRGYLGAAEAYIALGETDKAIEVLRRGLEQLPVNWDIADKLKELTNQAPKAELLPESVSAATSLPTSESTPEHSPVPAPEPTQAPTPEPTLTPTEQPISQKNSIAITNVSPQSIIPGKETTFTVTIDYTSVNVDYCNIYATIIYVRGENDSHSSFSSYNEYVLPGANGTYTFNFTDTVYDTGQEVGVYVELYGNSPADSWDTLDVAVYPLSFENVAISTPTPEPTIEPLPTPEPTPMRYEPRPVTQPPPQTQYGGGYAIEFRTPNSYNW